MDEIFDLLHERNEPVSAPLELPDEDLLVVIEEELLMAIPKDFRVYLLNASDVVYGRLEPATVADPNSHTYLPEMAAVAWSLGLPRKYLPICESEGGYYCINRKGAVRFWDERIIKGQKWESLWEWIQEVWLAD